MGSPYFCWYILLLNWKKSWSSIVVSILIIVCTYKLGYCSFCKISFIIFMLSYFGIFVHLILLICISIRSADIRLDCSAWAKWFKFLNPASQQSVHNICRCKYNFNYLGHAACSISNLNVHSNIIIENINLIMMTTCECARQNYNNECTILSSWF
jgi:hypothetical protein